MGFSLSRRGSYRVNYGNGTVSRTYATLAECEAHIREQFDGGGTCFIQRYDAGTADDPCDWFRVRRNEIR